MPRNDFVNVDGTINYDNIPSTNQVAIISVKQYGAKGDGVTDDYLAFNRLITSVGSSIVEVYLPSGTYIIGTNLTIPSNISLIFANGAVLSPNTSITITINGYIDSPMSQIFSGTGTIGGTFKNREVMPQWFGAKGDGITDDVVAIQNALNIASGKNTTFLSNTGSTYLIGNNIIVPSNTHLILEGVIKLANNINKTVLFISPGTNIVIEGNGKIDGNKANQTLGTIAGIYTTAGSSYITIKGITITNCYNWAVNIVGSNNVLLDSIITSNSGNSTEFAAGSYNCWARNIEVYGITDEGFAFYGGVYNSGIIGSIIHGNTIDGISVLNDAGQPAACHDLMIIGNTCYNNSYSGIDVNSNQGTVVQNYSITISDNVIHHNNQINIGGLGGIWLNNGKYITISDNVIHHDGNGTVSTVGINIDPQAKGVSYITVKNNIIYNEGQGGGLGIGIAMSNTPINIVIEGNILNDDQTTKTTAYHLNGGPATNIIIRNNILGTSLGAANHLTVGTINLWEGNIGYNPVGQLTAPTIPASTVAQINNFAVPARIFVTGGTVTNVSVNGVNTGLTSGQFYLMPSETITLTYSVAPTWTWFGV